MDPDICVILPTVRETECLTTYIENANRHGFDTDRLHVVVITEDFCDTQTLERELSACDVSGVVFDGTARDQWFHAHGIESFAHLIPGASHAETSFGLLYLWANDFAYGVFIDDDTRPRPDTDYFGTHLRNLAYTGPVTMVESDTGWVNVLYQNADTHGLYPRGFPYGAMNESYSIDQATVTDVVVSQGLWTNVPDLDAVRILADGDLDGRGTTRTTARDFDGPFVTAPGDYLTVCSMNLAFKREIVPAFYQLPMDDNPWEVGRFDDIWSGVLLKRVTDRLGTHIMTGPPLCEHNKIPRSTFADLQSEAAGLELNEHLWRIAAAVDSTVTSYGDMYGELARVLETGDWSEYHNGGFLNMTGTYMHDWLACLGELTADAPPSNAVPSDVLTPE